MYIFKPPVLYIFNYPLIVFSSVQFAIVQLPQRSCCIKYFLLPVAEILPAEVDSLPVVGVFKAVVGSVHHVLADKNMGNERRCYRGLFDYSFFFCWFCNGPVIFIDAIRAFINVADYFFNVFCCRNLNHAAAFFIIEPHSSGSSVLLPAFWFCLDFVFNGYRRTRIFDSYFRIFIRYLKWLFCIYFSCFFWFCSEFPVPFVGKKLI